MKKIKKPWEWFGSAGHYICSPWCRFHLTTLVGKYLISTVGEYIPPTKPAGWAAANYPGQDIGSNRKYETMVFKAGRRCRMKECNCGMPNATSPELELRGYNRADDATKGHMACCKKWDERGTVDLLLIALCFAALFLVVLCLVSWSQSSLRAALSLGENLGGSL